MNIEDILVSVCPRLYKQVKTGNTAVCINTYMILYVLFLINEFDLVKKKTSLLCLLGSILKSNS